MELRARPRKLRQQVQTGRLRYVSELKKISESQRAQIKEHNQEIAEGVFVALQDPKKLHPVPVAEALPPYFNFAPLDQAVEDLSTAATSFDDAYEHYVASGNTDINARLLLIDRAQQDPDGLPGRSWYQNLIYAPGLYSGYGVKTLPLVREALEQKRWSDVDAAIVQTARVLEREVEELKSATDVLNSK